MQTPFTPPPGLTSDNTTFALPGQWANGSLARFYNGNWQIKGGWERLTLAVLNGVCRTVYAWLDTTNNQDIAFGNHNGLQLWQAGLLYDITPASFVAGSIDGTGQAGYGTGPYGQGTYGTTSAADQVGYYPLTWSLSNYGGDLIANPRGQTIFIWHQNAGQVAVPLTGAPANVVFTLTTPQRQVMAFGCNEEVSGVFNPCAIRWSDIEDYNDWTTSPTNNAGEWILASGGKIVCARNIGDYLFVWTTVGLFLGTFVGAPGQTWKFERAGENCGAISPGAPIVKLLHAVWLSPDKVFWECSLGSEPTRVDCPIRQMFIDDIAQGQAEKIVGSSVSSFGEFSWFYPDGRDGFEMSRSITLNPDGWSHDLLARSAFVDAKVTDYPIGVSPDGQIFYHEKGNSADGQPMTGFLESSDFYLSEAEGGMLVNGMYPDFKLQAAPIQMTIFAREFPQSAERVHGPWTLVPGQNKRSFRLSGRIARVRFDWSSTPCFARGGRPEFDVQAIGGRG
jgi:hypothetical protein